MDYGLIFVTVLLFTLQTICFKAFSRRFMTNRASYFSYSFLYFVLVVLVLLPGAGAATLHLQTAALAVGFGVLFVLTMMSYMKAMDKGPLSFTSLIFMSSLLVPILMGILWWDEKATALQLAALVLLIVTFYLGNEPSGQRRASGRWALLTLLAFAGNGVMMTLFKTHQRLLPGLEIREFLLIAFSTAALFCLILFARYRFGAGEPVDHLRKGSFALIVLGTALTTAFGNRISLYLAGRIPAIVQFPVMNGGIVVLTAVVSVLFFGEKLTRRSVAGLLLGVTSLVLFCL